MPKFYIVQSRYVQQVGQTQPSYVLASPDSPAVIELPDDHPVDRGLRPVEQGELPELKKHFAAPGIALGQPVAAAATIQSEPVKPAPGKSTQRPSDKGPL